MYIAMYQVMIVIRWIHYCKFINRATVDVVSHYVYVSVFGDYDYTDEPFNITYGHSKDKRPDLKQFLISLLCVDLNIPILVTTEDGNASDKTLNNELLGSVSKHMARHGLGPGAFVYVADSANTARR